jgi:hypothetical protein
VRVIAGVLLLLVSAPAWAIRPFITDDARVVGLHVPQLETWMQVDGVSLQHWVVPAFGPTDDVELTIGFVHGASYRADAPVSYAIAGPLIQAKVLLHEATKNRAPGVAIAGGLLLPHAGTDFSPPDIRGFVYVALTETLGERERVNIHANLGVSLAHEMAGVQKVAIIGGVGTQIRTWRGLHVVAEIVHGDAYAGDVGGAVQAGFRYIFGDHVQMDTTAGIGTWGDTPRGAWGTLGLRLAGNPLW